MADKVKATYDESSIEVIREDVEKIKKQPTMYIGYRGEKAFLHLIKEVLQNSIDEANVEGGCCDEIIVTYNEVSKVATVMDNGRGFPHGAIVDSCTVIQSSGKFSKGDGQAYKFAAGTHGVGITATNALSVYMKVISCRNDKKYLVEFSKGHPVSQKAIGKCDKNSTYVEFVPNEEILDECNLPATEVINLCETMSYLSKGTKIKYNCVLKNGKNLMGSFKSKNGLFDLLDKKTNTKLFEPIYIGKFGEDKAIEVYMTYSPNSEGENITSFANFCTTIDHGSHVSGFKAGLTTVLSKYIKDECLNKKEKDLNITPEDLREGLVCIVNSYHTNAHYVGQVKEKIDNPDLVPFARNVVVDGLNDWIKNNPKTAKKLGEFIKAVAKQRNKSKEVRSAMVKAGGDKGFFDSDMPPMKKYSPPHGTTKEEKANYELIIIEGDSAAGSVRPATDKRYQGVFALKGKPPNSYDLKWYAAAQKDELKYLLNVLGCGIGKTFDITKCKFKRIIIMTDADVDGYHIRTLLSGFFLRHLPQLVEDGRVYVASPPLYRVKKNKKDVFIKDNKEYVEYTENFISSKFSICDVDNNKLSHKEIKNVLEINRDYVRMLRKTANRYMANQYLLEKTVYNILSNEKITAKQLQKILRKDYPYLNVNSVNGGLQIEGLADKEYQYFVIDDKFWKKTKDLAERQRQLFSVPNRAGCNMLYVDNELLTIGQFLNKIEDADSSRIRFKGLGEMKASTLWDIALDPETRKLVRLTTENINKDVDNFAVLQSDKAISQRRELISSFKLDFSDLDT